MKIIKIQGKQENENNKWIAIYKNKYDARCNKISCTQNGIITKYLNNKLFFITILQREAFKSNL